MGFCKNLIKKDRGFLSVNEKVAVRRMQNKYSHFNFLPFLGA